jgi:hypothetical protein
MDLAQFHQLESARVTPSVVGVAQLVDRTPRTLLYGYDAEHRTWHVYLDEDGLLHRFVHGDRASPVHAAGPTGGCTENRQYVPSRRLYPESCDYEFCRLLLQAGESLPFTTFDVAADQRRRAVHHGYAGETFAQAASRFELL